jgi:hypothetical protein
MDLNKLFSEEGTKETVLNFEGEDLCIKIRPLSWSKKNQILSRCFSYSQSGEVAFNFDRYLKEMLCEMIVEAPWGETNHIFLTRIKPEFGAILEKLVPKAFQEIKEQNFFGEK